MKTSDFDYFLPKELIAQKPLEKRDSSRLLVLDKKKGAIEHRDFYNIIDYLDSNDLLVLNSTKVLPARLLGQKVDSGAKVEIFLLHPTSEDHSWECLVRPGRKLKEDVEVEFPQSSLRARIISRTETGGRIVKFTCHGNFMEELEKVGQIPLPPYIKEKLDDANRYQTVYSKMSGSVAAPTAGLHFTEELMEIIRQKNIEIAEITLHVGLGTFRPVSSEDILEHKMHSEYFFIDSKNKEIIEKALKDKKRIVAAGTTTTRTLETVVENGLIIKDQGWTDIFIYPGYKFKMVDALITNFHLPKSTLLMLVSALATKENIIKAYQIAQKEKYRFFSFGDSMFIK